MHGNILPALPGQSVTSLSDLAKAIRAEHAAVVSALSGAVEHAIKCGEILAAAKEMAGHGRWLEFLRACDLGERQAQRYMRLALLAEQTRLAKSDLTGMTIEGAIKHLAPPKTGKPATAPKPIVEPRPPAANSGRQVAHVDIIEVWLPASPADRTKAIDAIGLEPWLAAIPAAWLPLLAERFADRPVVAPEAVAESEPSREAVARLTATISEDLSIPPFLRRAPTPALDEREPPPEEAPVPASTVAVVGKPPVADTTADPLDEHPLLRKARSGSRLNIAKAKVWRRLCADDLEELIRDAQRYGVDHADEVHAHRKRRFNQLDLMRKRLTMLRDSDKFMRSLESAETARH